MNLQRIGLLIVVIICVMIVVMEAAETQKRLNRKKTKRPRHVKVVKNPNTLVQSNQSVNRPKGPKKTVTTYGYNNERVRLGKPRGVNMKGHSVVDGKQHSNKLNSFDGVRGHISPIWNKQNERFAARPTPPKAHGHQPSFDHVNRPNQDSFTPNIKGREGHLDITESNENHHERGSKHHQEPVVGNRFREQSGPESDVIAGSRNLEHPGSRNVNPVPAQNSPMISINFNAGGQSQNRENEPLQRNTPSRNGHSVEGRTRPEMHERQQSAPEVPSIRVVDETAYKARLKELKNQFRALKAELEAKDSKSPVFILIFLAIVPIVTLGLYHVFVFYVLKRLKKPSKKSTGTWPPMPPTIDAKVKPKSASRKSLSSAKSYKVTQKDKTDSSQRS